MDKNALIKRVPELYVDLSSIAKGYGVDVVAEYLEAQNIKDYMVDIGGKSVPVVTMEKINLGVSPLKSQSRVLHNVPRKLLNQGGWR